MAVNTSDNKMNRYYIGGIGYKWFGDDEDCQQKPETLSTNDCKIVRLIPQWLIDWEKEQGYER